MSTYIRSRISPHDYTSKPNNLLSLAQLNEVVSVSTDDKSGQVTENMFQTLRTVEIILSFVPQRRKSLSHSHENYPSSSSGHVFLITTVT